MDEVSREELEDEVTLLRQQLAAVTGSSEEIGVLMALGYGMTHRLAMMLYILVKRAPAVISRQAFHSVFYGDRSDGGPEPKIFAVNISRLRAILRRSSARGKIDTIWSGGYRASPELVAWALSLYEQQIPQEK